MNFASFLEISGLCSFVPFKLGNSKIKLQSVLRPCFVIYLMGNTWLKQPALISSNPNSKTTRSTDFKTRNAIQWCLFLYQSTVLIAHDISYRFSFIILCTTSCSLHDLKQSRKFFLMVLFDHALFLETTSAWICVYLAITLQHLQSSEMVWLNHLAEMHPGKMQDKPPNI